MVTIRALDVAPCTVPSRLTGCTHPIDSRAWLSVFTIAAPEFTSAPVLPSITVHVTELPLIPRLAHTLPAARVTLTVLNVTVATPVTQRPPPARLALAGARPLLAC